MQSSAFDLNFHTLLKNASDLNASDLHIEPYREKVRIRARIDGVLTVIQEIKNEKYCSRFLMKAKNLCNFDMSKNMEPQDSRFRCEDIPFDLRGSLVPTMHGEKIVLRFLERNKNFSIDSYPMPEEARRDLKNILDKWQGLVLVSGPVGSGKTTLLYSALASIDLIQNNIHTLEDPIEYELEGAGQTQVSGAMGFSNGLKYLLRQDLDVILVGETRDHETAHTLMHAASTGHLVFSTIHANSAMECIDRLVGLGVSKDILEANLIFASAQRLVPKNCPYCIKEDDESVELVKNLFNEKFIPKKSEGCPECFQTGIKGRVLLFEYLVKKETEIGGEKKLFLQGSLKNSALEHLRKGNISAQNACAFV